MQASILRAYNSWILHPRGTGGQSHTTLLSASSGGAGIDAALPHTPLGYEQNDMQQPLLSAMNKDDLQPGGTGGQSHAMLLSASSGGAGIDAALPQLSQGDK